MIRIEEIPITSIDETVPNHRLVTDPQSDQQLVESIRANGVQQPVKVSTNGGDRYILVFGFRRKAAAESAGLETIPAIVEHNLDDDTIRQLQAIENLERKDLHPLEEAQFCHDLSESIEDEDAAEAVSQRIGRSKKWVEGRLAMSRLSERVKQAFIDGDIHLGHAQQIARLAGHELQEEVLGAVQATVCSWLTNAREQRESRQPPGTIAETRRQVQIRMRDLDAVAWKLDAEFAGKIGCTACPHNSANRLDLFDGDQPKKPQCLEASCYSEKTKAASRAVVKATNTLIKSEAKHTVPQASKAIAEREVEFVEPKAVVAAAKRRANPQKHTAGERRGFQDQERHWKIQHRLRDLESEWVGRIHAEINEYLPFLSPGGLAMLILICESGLMNSADPRPYQEVEEDRQAEARKDLRQALELLKAKAAVDDQSPARDDPLIRLTRLLHPWILETVEDELAGIDALSLKPWSNYARQALCEAYGIDTKPFGPQPTVESVEAELYPPAKPKAKKAKGKKEAST